ncbi:MAG: BatA domain-containing protein [Planctomycetota bacterium]
MNLSFGLPAMLGGAALVSVPILIHLLNRRRFVIQPFAAMRFLTEAFAERRKRLRMESLLLLLLRCLVVLLAVFAMSLPFVPEDSPLALVAGGRRELVAIVDRSGSMGRLAGPGTTLDDRVLATLRRRLAALSDERGDGVTLITMGSGPSLPAAIGATPSMALAALERDLPPPGGVADLVAAARLLRDRVRPARPGRLDVVLYTDMQRLSWAASGASLGSLFAEVFEDGGGSLRIVPVARDLAAPANFGVLSLEAQEPLLLSGEPMTFTAVVRNWSEAPRNGLELRFHVDDVQRSVQRLDLPPLGTATATLRQRIDTPGPHHVSVALEADELPFDDARTLAFAARERLSILIVDGAPGGADPLSGAAGYLALALDPVGEAHRFEPVVWEVGRFESEAGDVASFDAVVLADVGALSRSAVESLRRAVEGGLPLLVFCGDNLDTSFYNVGLPGLGLTLPATIGEVTGDPGGRTGEDYVTLALPETEPGPLGLFADPRLSVLLQVPVFAWRPLEPQPESRILANFAGAAGRTEPAIVEGLVGRGRVVVFGTAADTSWSLLPRNPALWLPLVHELLSALVAIDPAEANVPVGHAPTLTVDGLPRSAELTWPGKAVTTIEVPPSETDGRDGARRSLLELDGTPLDEPGAYLLSVTTSAGQEDARVYALAALPDAREGDLSTVDERSLADTLAGVEFEVGAELDDIDGLAAQPGDGSLAQALLWALLVAALAEAALARLMGRVR